MRDDHEADTLGLAERFRAHLEAKDADAFLGLFHDDGTTWRNFDRRTLDKPQLAKVIRFLTRVEGLRYEDVRVRAQPDGWVQQHRLCGRAGDGVELDVDVCLIVKVRAGKIAHLDEYLDSKALQPLLPR